MGGNVEQMLLEVARRLSGNAGGSPRLPADVCSTTAAYMAQRTQSEDNQCNNTAPRPQGRHEQGCSRGLPCRGKSGGQPMFSLGTYLLRAIFKTDCQQSRSGFPFVPLSRPNFQVRSPSSGCCVSHGPLCADGTY